MLYRLLQFSELSHNILHGSYDDLPGSGEYHSDRYDWDFNVDVARWKVMHHEGHHPYTNIVGRDHDLGQRAARGQAAQDWFGHHAVQVAFSAPSSRSSPSWRPFWWRTSPERLTEAGFGPGTLRGPLRIALADTKAVGHRAVVDGAAVPAGHGGQPYRWRRGLCGGALPSRHRTSRGRDGSLRRPGTRQRPTTVLPAADPQHPQLSAQSATGFGAAAHPRGGGAVRRSGRISESSTAAWTPISSTTCSRTCRRTASARSLPVKEIVTRYGLPYHQTPLGETAALLFKTLTGLSVPVGERESGHPLMLLKRQAGLAPGYLRVRYRRLPDAPYLDKPRWYNVPVRVVATEQLAHGQALTIRLERPPRMGRRLLGPGAFVSLRIEHGDETLIRQYSLVHDSDDSDTMDICVKRVQGGRVSNLFNDALRVGDYLTLLGPPVSTGGWRPRSPCQSAVRRRRGRYHADHQSAAAAGPLRRTPDAVLLYFNHDNRILFEHEIAELGELEGSPCMSSPDADPLRI